MDDDGFKLNIRARSALSGSSLDWRSDLVALLRSDVALDRPFRDALAGAFGNTSDFGPRLDLRNVQSSSNRTAAIAARYEWMRIGQWIYMLRDQGLTNEEAIDLMVEQLGVSEGKCKKALAYYQRAAPLIEDALTTDPGQVMGREIVENMYHQVFAYPKDKTFARMNAGLLRMLGIPHLKAVGGPAPA